MPNSQKAPRAEDTCKVLCQNTAGSRFCPSSPLWSWSVPQVDFQDRQVADLSPPRQKERLRQVGQTEQGLRHKSLKHRKIGYPMLRLTFRFHHNF